MQDRSECEEERLTSRQQYEGVITAEERRERAEDERDLAQLANAPSSDSSATSRASTSSDVFDPTCLTCFGPWSTQCRPISLPRANRSKQRRSKDAVHARTPAPLESCKKPSPPMNPLSPPRSLALLVRDPTFCGRVRCSKAARKRATIRVGRRKAPSELCTRSAPKSLARSAPPTIGPPTRRWSVAAAVRPQKKAQSCGRTAVSPVARFAGARVLKRRLKAATVLKAQASRAIRLAKPRRLPQPVHPPRLHPTRQRLRRPRRSKSFSRLSGTTRCGQR